ncbi:PAP2 superfamily protein [Methylibium sp. T29]|nr:PAP2 superfamily protein [Methylibium sp. T29]EWS60158.1 PAP2 superfamily protein [Methylibium sp. T29-B]
MLAAAIYPVLARTLASPAAVPPRWAIVAGYALAAVISLSRVVIGAHSVSEVVLGFAVGGAASAVALMLETRHPPPLPKHWLVVGLAGWLTLMPVVAAPSGTHGWCSGWPRRCRIATCSSRGPICTACGRPAERAGPRPSARRLQSAPRLQRSFAHVAAVEVVVDQPHRLHERVDRGRADEAPAAPLQVLAHRH